MKTKVELQSALLKENEESLNKGVQTGKTLYEYWQENNLPVNLHEATEYIFHAYKYGASGHVAVLRKAFPDYFVDVWTTCCNHPDHELSKEFNPNPQT